MNKGRLVGHDGLLEERQGGEGCPVLLALGSNLGPRLRNLQGGLAALLSDGRVVLEAASSLYASDPVDAEGGEFFNAVVRLRTSLSPKDVLDRTRAIEVRLGRRGSGHDARPLDLDLLYYGELRCRTARLELPHPRLRERPFVRLPLLEVCGDLGDPVTGGAIRDWIAPHVPGDRGVLRRLQGPDWALPCLGSGGMMYHRPVPAGSDEEGRG